MQIPLAVPSPPQSGVSVPLDPANKRPARGWGPRAGWGAFAVALACRLLAMLRIPTLNARLVPAVSVTLAFTLFAWLLRGVTAGGALAGFLATAVLFVASGPPIFGAVLLVFVLTHAATRLGRVRKRSLAIAELSSGRDAAQVLANVGVAALAAGFAQSGDRQTALLVACVAALAEAASDTVASETGKALSGTARMITSWQSVPAGTDGAISLPGTLLGSAAAALVALEAAATGIASPPHAAIAGLAGIAGMHFDSLLGATLEKRGCLTNNAVNLLSTAGAALLALTAVWISS